MFEKLCCEWKILSEGEKIKLIKRLSAAAAEKNLSQQYVNIKHSQN